MRFALENISDFSRNASNNAVFFPSKKTTTTTEMSTHDIIIIIIIERHFIVISCVYRLNCFSSYEITQNIQFFFFLVCQSMLLFNIQSSWNNLVICMTTHTHTLVTGLLKSVMSSFRCNIIGTIGQLYYNMHINCYSIGLFSISR